MGRDHVQQVLQVGHLPAHVSQQTPAAPPWTGPSPPRARLVRSGKRRNHVDSLRGRRDRPQPISCSVAATRDCALRARSEAPARKSVVDAAESREAPAAPTPGRAIVAAVADGVSSMILSGEGAHLASEAAVDAAAEAFVHGELVPGDASALKGVFEYALRRAVAGGRRQRARCRHRLVCLVHAVSPVVWDGARGLVWQCRRPCDCGVMPRARQVYADASAPRPAFVPGASPA
ncbi:MAG: protein phosphatase 2C domain-containing protein [Collinsella sp.]